MEDKVLFTGEVKNIVPERIVKKEGINDEIDGFFLTLGLIYNDFKNLHFIWLLIFDKVEKPDINIENIVQNSENIDILFHSGEYNGIRNHLIRIIFSVMGEFLNFLNENKKVLDNYKFKIIETQLSRDIAETWQEWVNLAINKESLKESQISNILASVRGNVTFHYEKPEYLVKGFQEFFYSNVEKNIFNRRAYYALGASMDKTRIFYADAAAVFYVEKLFKDRNIKAEEVFDLITKLSTVIHNLLRIYLQNKKQNKL